MFLNSQTLASLRFFEAAARKLSFRKAAAELHVTDGAVSQQIKHLEEALGQKLFLRLPRRIALTEAGERFAATVRKALAEIEDEARAISVGDTRTEIRVRVNPSFALRWLMPRVGDFYAKHPGSKLFMIGEYGDIDLTERNFDITIEQAVHPLAGLHSERLFDEYITPVCTPAYLQGHPLNTPGGLATCTLLHDAHAWSGGANDAEWQVWLQEAGVLQIEASQGRFFSLADMAIQAALNDQGVAMGRTALVGDLLKAGALVAPFALKVKSPASYWLAFPSAYSKTPAIEIVGNWLRSEVKRFLAQSPF